jgi:hypothetical protein
MAYEVVITAIEKGYSAFPKFILKRVYTQTKLNEQILIDTRSVNPILFSLNGFVPMVNAWFTITNMTNLSWKVHDFSADIWVGQPLVTTICHDKPSDIYRKKRVDVFTKSELNEFQVNRLKEYKERRAKGLIDNVTIYVNAHFESKIGLMEFKPTLENRQITILG